MLVNGCPGPWFTCKKGLRQGDPLSPYLFLLVADDLQVLIKTDGSVRHPLEDGRPCPVLQYADDTLLLLRAELSDVLRLRTLLSQFAAATDLHINFSKSIVVPMHVPAANLQPMVTALGCQQATFLQTYLGLPLSNTKLNISAFAPLISRADHFLPSRKASLLNPMGLCVLVNAVLDALPTYAMVALQLPRAVIDGYDARRRAFLWAGENKASGALCLVSWERCCKPCSQGGLGLRDMQLQNQCLLLKLLHRIHSPGDSSRDRWVRSRIDQVSLQGDVEGSHWEGLCQLLPIYRAITVVQLKDGNNTSFWEDTWTPGGCLADTFPALYSHSTNTNVLVWAVVQDVISPTLQPRLTAAAEAECADVQVLVRAITLQDGDDVRHSSLFDAAGNLRSALIYKLAMHDGVTSCPFEKFV